MVAQNRFNREIESTQCEISELSYYLTRCLFNQSPHTSAGQNVDFTPMSPAELKRVKELEADHSSSSVCMPTSPWRTTH